MTEVAKKTLGLAVFSLVLGCLFIIPLLGMIFGIAAITLGVIALSKISKDKETLKGNGFAIIEMYRAETGSYPLSQEEFFSADPPYLPEGFGNKVRTGYKLTLELDGGDYRIYAAPENCGTTGTKNIIFHAGELLERECQPSYR